MTSLVNIQLGVGISSHVKIGSNAVEDSRYRNKEGVLGTSNKGRRNKASQGLEDGLVATLDTVERIGLLVKAWSSVKVGILNIERLARCHDRTANHKARDERANDAGKNDVAILGRELNGDGHDERRNEDTEYSE